MNPTITSRFASFLLCRCQRCETDRQRHINAIARLDRRITELYERCGHAKRESGDCWDPSDGLPCEGFFRVGEGTE